MKCLVIADPVAKLKAATDTSFAIVRESLKRRHKVYWATDVDVRMETGRIRVQASAVRECALDQSPALDSPQDFAIRDFKAVWIRKDPPFDSSYLTLCWLLALEEKHVLMVNRPSLLLRLHEKLLPFEAMAGGFLKASDLVPTHIGSSASAREFLEKGAFDPAIRKPFLGFGGADIRKFSLKAGDALPNADQLELTQPFLPEISEVGDRRVLYIGGNYVADFVRLPAPGGIVSNIARGGSGHLAKLTARQKSVMERTGKFLKKAGVIFAGADLIGNRISEINITSPTGVRTLVSIGGEDIVPKIVSYVERAAL